MSPLMPIRYTVDATHNRLNTRADGLVTFHEINEHLDMEERHRRLDLPELFDARGASTDLTEQQVRRLVDRATTMLRAVDLGATAVVTNDPVVFGMAQIYAVLAEQAGIVAGVFYDIDTASHWLDQYSKTD